MIHDDPRKLAKPLKGPATVSFKKSRKNAFNTDGGKIGRKNALNQYNAHDLTPEQYLSECQRKEPRKGKTKKHTVDPFMVRQAKLKAKGESK